MATELIAQNDNFFPGVVWTFEKVAAGKKKFRAWLSQPGVSYVFSAGYPTPRRAKII